LLYTKEGHLTFEINTTWIQFDALDWTTGDLTFFESD